MKKILMFSLLAIFTATICDASQPGTYNVDRNGCVTIGNKMSNPDHFEIRGKDRNHYDRGRDLNKKQR